MEEYLELRQTNAEKLTSCSRTCAERLKKQSSLSTYHRTKVAELQTYQIFEKQAEIEKDCCKSIRRVIDNYREKVNKMFPRAHFHTTHHHFQTHDLKSRFKRAHSSLH